MFCEITWRNQLANTAWPLLSLYTGTKEECTRLARLRNQEERDRGKEQQTRSKKMKRGKRSSEKGLARVRMGTKNLKASQKIKSNETRGTTHRNQSSVRIDQRLYPRVLRNFCGQGYTHRHTPRVFLVVGRVEIFGPHNSYHQVEKLRLYCVGSSSL